MKEKTKWKIHWFASTGDHHWNGSSVMRRAKMPGIESATRLGRARAEKLAKRHGKTLTQFEVRHILLAAGA